jgi:vacuolar-type H+-ATPase subunit I/STV1
LSYDQDLLQKVEEILAFSSLHVEMKPKTDDTSFKIDENIAADENERTSSRQKKKAVRNKRKQSQRAKKTNLISDYIFHLDDQIVELILFPSYSLEHFSFHD